MYGTIQPDRTGDRELIEDVAGAKPGKRHTAYRAAYGRDHVHIKSFGRSDRGYREAKNHVASHLILEELGIDLPDMSYNPSKNEIVTEWIYNAERADQLDEGDIQVDRDSYLDAAASRLLIGDADVQHIDENFLIQITGTVYPFDFDGAGHDLDRHFSSKYRLDRQLYPQILEETEATGIELGIDISQDNIAQHAYQLASQLDPEEIAAKLDNHPHLRQFDRKDNFIHNIQLLQKADLQPE